MLNATNASIQWFTKAGVQQVHTSLNNFFQRAESGAVLCSTRKSTYDQYNERFMVVALEVLDTGFGDPVNSSRVLIAVSDDSDPNGSWHYQAFNTLQMINGVPQWLDYPGLAVDENAIYITGNMFPFGTSTATFGGSRLLIINKGDGTGGLYDGGFSTMNIYNPAGSLAATQGFTLQPAQTWGTTPVFGSTTNRVGTWLTAYNGGTAVHERTNDGDSGRQPAEQSHVRHSERPRSATSITPRISVTRRSSLPIRWTPLSPAPRDCSKPTIVAR